jgi:alkanesulfonate monooxygenase SsuD/methylene tetrahydromethanopterin reductase-like flavin-dependent oxidoreductase (luciferase family)
MELLRSKELKMEISISIEGLFGLSWSSWKMITAEVERLGFAGAYCSDHFVPWEAPVVNSLEVYIALAYLANQSQHIKMGTMVSPLSFRDPIMAARQALALAELSGGRMILGIGAGCNQYQHDMFGYRLGDSRTRLDRFEEGLEVIAHLIRSDEPVTFDGNFFQLREARLLPRSSYPLPVLIGGKGAKRLLRLVARFADVWNLNSSSIEMFKEQNAALDNLLGQAGRKPTDVKRTVAFPAYCWRDAEERQHIEDAILRIPHFSAIPRDILWETFRTQLQGIVGTPEQVAEHFSAFKAAGVEEIVIQYPTVDTAEPLYPLSGIVREHFQ